MPFAEFLGALTAMFIPTFIGMGRRVVPRILIPLAFSNLVIGIGFLATDEKSSPLLHGLFAIGFLLSFALAFNGNTRTKKPSPTPSANSSIADELSKLAELRKSGALSESEFQVAKARLLGTSSKSVFMGKS